MPGFGPCERTRSYLETNYFLLEFLPIFWTFSLMNHKRNETRPHGFEEKRVPNDVISSVHLFYMFQSTLPASLLLWNVPFSSPVTPRHQPVTPTHPQSTNFMWKEPWLTPSLDRCLSCAPSAIDFLIVALSISDLLPLSLIRWRSQPSVPVSQIFAFPESKV